MKPIKSLILLAMLIATAATSCKKISSFRLIIPTDSTSVDPADTSKVIKSITITRYDSNHVLLDSGTKYFLYDTLYPQVIVSTKPITDTVEPFTGYIFFYTDQARHVTEIEGRNEFTTDSIRFRKMFYNYDGQGRVASAMRVAVDGTETSLNTHAIATGNGQSYFDYIQDVPNGSDNAFAEVIQSLDGALKSVRTGDNTHETFDTIMVDAQTGQLSPTLRSVFGGGGQFTLANITGINPANTQLHDLHKQLLLGVESLPGAFFDDVVFDAEIAREYQPFLPLTADVTLEQADKSRITTSFKHSPVLDSLNRLTSIDFYTIVNNRICTQHWSIKYY